MAGNHPRFCSSRTGTSSRNLARLSTGLTSGALRRGPGAAGRRPAGSATSPQLVPSAAPMATAVSAVISFFPFRISETACRDGQ